MTGTGTQTDPYIVDNWDDFITATGTSGAYVAFPEGGGVIDVDKVYPLGVPKITMNCTQIDGNGWEIRGLYMDVTGNYAIQFGGSNTTINNLSFLNVNIKSSTCLFSTSNLKITFNKVRISGRFSSSSSNATTAAVFYPSGSSSPKFTLNRCSFNLELIGNYTAFDAFYSDTAAKYGGVSLQYCNILLNVINHNVSSIYSVFNRCYLTGTIIRGSYNLNGANEQMFVYQSSGSDCVFLGEITTDKDSLTLTLGNGSSTSKMLFNADKISDKITVTAKSDVYLCTTEQLKDADYLKSIGFPIGE